MRRRRWLLVVIAAFTQRLLLAERFDVSGIDLVGGEEEPFFDETLESLEEPDDANANFVQEQSSPLVSEVNDHQPHLTEQRQQEAVQILSSVNTTAREGIVHRSVELLGSRTSAENSLHAAFTGSSLAFESASSVFSEKLPYRRPLKDRGTIFGRGRALIEMVKAKAVSFNSVSAVMGIARYRLKQMSDQSALVLGFGVGLGATILCALIVVNCWKGTGNLPLLQRAHSGESAMRTSTSSKSSCGTVGMRHHSGEEVVRKPPARLLSRITSDVSTAGRPEIARGGALLQHFELGDVLGEGAFGVVYSCKTKDTGEEFAVKMIDKVETKSSDIGREVEMMRRLNHPCVVQLHDVYFEKVFVCLVMDLIPGGDLVEAMAKHWEDTGMLTYDVVQNVAKQIISSIAWLHSQNFVHRDVKGDNFLMDKHAITDLTCRFYLSDFGTVLACEPGQRFKERVGTKKYWSPEFYARDYGIKVDVWALGVVMYGMMTAEFPFKNERDVRYMKLKFKDSVPVEGKELIEAMLCREEAKRLSAEEALASTFLCSFNSSACKEVGEFDGSSKKGLQEKGANLGVIARRRELVSRLQGAMRKGRASINKFGNTLMHLKDFGTSFQVELQPGIIRSYEWWPREKAAAHNLIDSNVETVNFDDPSHRQAQLELVQETLSSRFTDLSTESGGRMSVLPKANTLYELLGRNNVRMHEWGQGQAKTLDDLSLEVATGSCSLMLDAASYKNIVRVVQVVLVRIYFEEEERPGGPKRKRFLINSLEQYPDGRARQAMQLPGALKQPPLNGVQAARQIVREQLDMADCEVVFDFNERECFEDEEESTSYPGLRTVYQKEIFEGKVTTKDPSILRRICVLGTGMMRVEDAKNWVRLFAWLTEEVCASEKVKLKAPKEEVEVSALVNAPIGYEEEELSRYLSANNIDVSQFGQGTNRSLEQFSKELVSGEAALVRRNEKIIRVVDIVLLNIVKDDGSVLVEASETVKGATQMLNRLPGCKRRSDENHFLAAQRVLRKALRIDENSVNISPDNVKFSKHEQASKGYCGLPSAYQKHYLTGTLNTDHMRR